MLLSLLLFKPFLLNHHLQLNGRGAFTEYYSLSVDGNVVYKSAAESFMFFPTETGTFEFKIEATNNNGTTINSQSLLLIVVPEQSGDDLWSVGMSWEYSLIHALNIIKIRLIQLLVPNYN